MSSLFRLPFLVLLSVTKRSRKNHHSWIIFDLVPGLGQTEMTDTLEGVMNFQHEKNRYFLILIWSVVTNIYNLTHSKMCSCSTIIPSSLTLKK